MAVLRRFREQAAVVRSRDEARNVAAGNAVLAGIAASDAICCIRLGSVTAGKIITLPLICCAPSGPTAEPSPPP
ncbi:hypothetical protein [Haloechinothrix salitolerans]|uniref:Uncharacterized protein n=1 Tax=Haloechinothrix salitolerans TaxID=926830 RepID=A0ABW2BU92_9PSEU